MNLILLNKKPGITSFAALKDIKKAMQTDKVGHTGTLDKFAQGLIIVLTGKALKLSRLFLNSDKQYIAKIHFGTETDTLDPEGRVIAESRLPCYGDVFNAIWQHLGKIMQEPPVYSALHINGKRASQLARSGIVPQMKPRPVTIYKMEFLSWQPPFAEIFVHCSSGTYIRSLARDIALKAGSRGHLAELVRTKIAGFELTMNSEQLAMNSEQSAMTKSFCCQFNNFDSFLSPIPIDKSVIIRLGLPILDISLEDAQYIKHGKPLKNLCINENLNAYICIALFCEECLIAIIEKKDDTWKYQSVFV